ncbi:MAG: hypothetical protein WAU07_03930 [Microgenomates group bacterium]
MAILGAMIGGGVVHVVTHNPVLTALGGTWGENLGYYGKFIYQEYKKKSKKEKITLVSVLKIFRDLLFEFGFAEYLDSFLFRPAAMYFFTQNMGNVWLGLFLGKLAADVTFYIPTIISYELKKKIAKD